MRLSYISKHLYSSCDICIPMPSTSAISVLLLAGAASSNIATSRSSLLDLSPQWVSFVLWGMLILAFIGLIFSLIMLIREILC